MQPELLRYSCQLALPGFDETTQVQLQKAKVLVIGAGGLGCPAALYLAAAGIGTIGIADFDIISINNLHRQVLYTPAEAGLKKAAIACKKLQQQNPGIILIAHEIKIGPGNVMEVMADYDIIVDCTDNFDTKYLLNDACVLSGKPLVYGAVYQYEGQVALWNVLNSDGTATPNYRDLFPMVNKAQIPGCAEGGVMPTLTGIIGCMQANEVIKYFTQQGDLLAGKMLMLDVRTMQSRIITLGKVSKTTITVLERNGTVPVILPKELRKAIDKNLYYLIDVRTTEEHKSSNIGGNNLPLNELEKNILLLPLEKSIVMYCASGKRSDEAVRRVLDRFPRANVFSLEGGLDAWMLHG